MAYVLNGTADSRLYRLLGLIANCQNFQVLMAVKRTGAQVGSRFIFTLRDYVTAGNGHDVLINDAGIGNGYAPVLLANYVAQAGPVDVLALDGWMWLALGGTNGTLTFRSMAHGGGAWTSDTVAQETTPYIDPTEFHVGDPGDGSSPFFGKIGPILEWNAERSGAELLAQAASASAIVTTGLVSHKTALGTTLDAALAGLVGSPFLSAGGVSLDGDGPSFGPTITGQIIFPTTTTIEIVTPVIVSITTASATATLTVGNIDPLGSQLILTRYPDAGGAPGPTAEATITHNLQPAEIQAGLAVLALTGHTPGLTYWYTARVARGVVTSSTTAAAAASFAVAATMVATEAPDVAAIVMTAVNVLTMDATETGDLGVDAIGPVITVFAPTVVSTAGTYTVTVTASDVTGVASMSIARDGTTIASGLVGPGPHTITETATFADNGTRDYVVSAVDLGGNPSTAPTKEVTINILQGAFAVTLAASDGTVDTAATVELTAAISSTTSPISEVIFMQDGYQLGAAINAAPWTRSVQFFSSADNGTRTYQARVTLADGRIGYSPIVPVVINIPASTVRTFEISIGLADIMEIPRLDTSRGILFKLFDINNGLPLAGASPTAQIAKDDGAFVDPTGIVVEVAIQGLYMYWPSADDVSRDGNFSIAIRAPTAQSVPIINAQVVTPYGKR